MTLGFLSLTLLGFSAPAEAPTPAAAPQEHVCLAPAVPGSPDGPTVGRGPKTPRPPFPRKQRPHTVLEEDNTSSADPRAEVLAFAGLKPGQFSAVPGRGAHPATSTPPEGPSLIYTLHTLLI
jgi:hypothetical protein